ncbi:MAG: glycosyltransferase family 2 protein [Chloroflexi bacterium]|nr:glycosyltransferase family 2 protein [Chloroflexota bacterium]
MDTQTDEERPRIIEFAPFCAVLLSRQLLETVGLLDEQFFLYYEDLDYCQRMRQAGYTLAMIPTAKVWHKVSVSTGGWHTPMERFLMAQSSGRYFRRHGQGWRMFFILPYRLASALRLTVVLSYKSEWRSLRAYWYGLWLGWRTGQANTPAPRWVRTQTQ